MIDKDLILLGILLLGTILVIHWLLLPRKKQRKTTVDRTKQLEARLRYLYKKAYPNNEKSKEQ